MSPVANMPRTKRTPQTRPDRQTTSLVWFLIALVVAGPNSGCKSFFWPPPVISNEHRAYYHRKVAEIDAEAAACPVVEGPQIYGTPPEIRDRLPEERLHDVSWPMTLFSAVRIALEHNQVIRQDAQFLSPNNPIFATIDANTSVYDPHIQDTNITFGNRGVGAAMADFQTQMTASAQWGRDDQFSNLAGFQQDFTDLTRQFGVRFEKQLALGGTVGLSQQINYTNTDNPSTGLNNSYTGPLSVDLSVPLWAASGTEFTQIAGPASFLVPRVTSVNQGIIIAQISSEIARIELETGIRGLVRDVVNLYWDLSLAYARVKTEQAATEDAEKVYDKAVAEFESGRTRAAEEAQSAETFFAAKARFEEALRIYDETERRLRRLLGLPVSDGRMIHPIDEPTLVHVPDNWNCMLADALARRPQIRQSKHSLRSAQLQLKAARSLARPRLDFVSSYSVNGFGDRLTGNGFSTNSYYGRLFDRSLTGWSTGLRFSMPLGFKLQRSQVANLELRVAKSKTQLAIAESEIAHELAVRYQNAKRWTRIVQNNDERRDAAARLVKSLEADYEFQRGDLDQLVRAQATLAQAEVEYRRALVEFRKAIAELDFTRATLLEANQISLVFPEIAVAGNVNGAPRPIWADALPLGHHLPERLPMDIRTSDPAILPASSGGAAGLSGAVGEVTTREVGRPRTIPDGGLDESGANEADEELRLPPADPPEPDVAWDEPSLLPEVGLTGDLEVPEIPIPDPSPPKQPAKLPPLSQPLSLRPPDLIEILPPEGWSPTSGAPRIQRVDHSIFDSAVSSDTGTLHEHQNERTETVQPTSASRTTAVDGAGGWR